MLSTLRHVGKTHAIVNVHILIDFFRYDWRQTPNDEHRLNKCSYSVRSGYVPMVNGKHFERGINISVKSQYLLGFNEPDHKVQANLTAAQAAIMWKEVEKNGVGKVLVSPAVTNIHWLEQFFHECHNCRVDHVAIHIYDWNCNVHRVMSKLKQAWDRFHKPIWLTEFACPRTTSANEQLRFMREILPLLEAAPYVFRYAWFASRWMVQGDYVDKSASLLKPYSADLTPLGHYYNNFIH